MKKATYQKWRYTILEEIIKDLDKRIEEAKSSRDNTLEYCHNEETGEIDTNCWCYNDYLDACDKVEALITFQKEVDKL